MISRDVSREKGDQPQLSQESRYALNRVTLGGPEATASRCRRHKRFLDQLPMISKTAMLTGRSSLHLLSLRDPDEVSSGPPTGSPSHDLSRTLNSETVSAGRRYSWIKTAGVMCYGR